MYLKKMFLAKKKRGKCELPLFTYLFMPRKQLLVHLVTALDYCTLRSLQGSLACLLYE